MSNIKNYINKLYKLNNNNDNKNINDKYYMYKIIKLSYFKKKKENKKE